MNNSENTPLNNIIAVASGKGGVGKTWLSITLAQLFARSGRRVLLFDGDIGLANVDVQLGLTPTKDLASVIREEKTLSDIVTHFDGKFDIVAGRSGSINMASLSLAKLTMLKEQLLELSKSYDYVIIDLGAGIEQYVQFMTTIASRCVVVVTDEPTSLTDAYAFIKLCTTRLHNPQVGIVVNQAASQKEGEKTYSALNTACVNFLKITPPLLGIVRKDNKVRDAIRAQKSLIDRAAHTTAASDAAAISIKLMQRETWPLHAVT
jgi:flagellar biosynthesis protein FlhG